MINRIQTNRESHWPDVPAGLQQGRPKLIAVRGARPGVGATTLAANLALALCHLGCRTVLLGSQQREEAATPTHGTINDVLSGTRSIHEVLATGCGGLQTVPAGAEPLGAALGKSTERYFLNALDSLTLHADVVVLDLDATLQPLESMLLSLADAALIVTSTQADAVLDCYRVIKAAPPARFQLVITQAINEASAAEVEARVAATCQSFLHVELQSAGCIPLDGWIPAATAEGESLLLRAPHSRAARAIRQIAELVWLRVQFAASSMRGQTSALAATPLAMA